MKGRSQFIRRLPFLHFLFAILFAQGWKTPAPFAQGNYFELTFFVRTNAASGRVVTRGFYSWTWSVDQQRFFTGVRLHPTGVTNEWLGIENNNVIRVRSNGEATIEIAPGLDLNNSPAAITFDSNRARAISAATGGEGELFQRPADQPWSLLSSLSNIDLVSLTYTRQLDEYWGLQPYQGAPTASATFSRFSPQGVKLGDLITTGLFTNVGPGGLACEMITVPWFSDIIFVMVERPYNQPLQPGDKSGFYELNPSTGYFSGSERTIVPRAPTVQFVSFNNSQTQFPPGTPFPVSLNVSDLDGDLLSVQLSCDGNFLKQWTFDPSSFLQINSLQTTWTTNASGLYTFSARAEDSFGNVTEKTSTLDVTINSGISVYRSMPTNVIAGQSFTVRLIASPGAGSAPWIMKEQPPSNWTVTAGNDATINPTTHEITWGPFTENPLSQRVLAYDVTAPVGANSVTFQGHVTINGASNPIHGRSTVNVLPPTETVVRRIDDSHVTFNFNATPGITFVVEASASLDSPNWTQVTIIVGSESPVEFGPVEILQEPKFYRLRPAF